MLHVCLNMSLNFLFVNKIRIKNKNLISYLEKMHVIETGGSYKAGKMVRSSFCATLYPCGKNIAEVLMLY